MLLFFLLALITSALIIFLPFFGVDSPAYIAYMDNNISFDHYGYNPIVLLMLVGEELHTKLFFALNNIVFWAASYQYINSTEFRKYSSFIILFFTVFPFGYLFLIDTQKQMLFFSLFLFSLSRANIVSSILYSGFSFATHRLSFLVILCWWGMHAISFLYLVLINILIMGLVYYNADNLTFILQTYNKFEGGITGTIRFYFMLVTIVLLFIIGCTKEFNKAEKFVFLLAINGSFLVYFIHPVFARVSVIIVFFLPFVLLRFVQVKKYGYFVVLLMVPVLYYVLMNKDYGV
jgi:hypothetical protein